MITAKRKLLLKMMTVSTLVVFSTTSFSNVSTTKLKSSKSNTVLTSLKTKNKKKEDSKLTGDFSFQSNEWVQDVGDVVGNKYFGEINIDLTEKECDLILFIQANKKVNQSGCPCASCSEIRTKLFSIAKYIKLAFLSKLR